MAKKIENKDLFGADLFKKTQEDVKLLVNELNLLEKELVSVATQQQKVLNTQDNKSLKSIQKTKKAVKQLSETELKATTIRKQKLNLERKLDIANATRTKDNARLNAQIQKQNQLTKDSVRETTKSLGAYTNLSAKLNRLRKEYKDLALTEGTTTKKTKALALQIQNLDTKLKGVDKTVGQSQRNVGNYGSAMSKVGGVLKGFVGALGITAGIAGLSRVLTGAIKTAKDFEQGNANLASVLGKTSKDITILTNDAKRLGAVTSFSATQVSTLQTEFAKLGFNEQEILNATEATLDLAAATGSDLGEAAAIAGATLGGFGLDASETGRVADVMAKSFSTSALDLEKFKEAMKGAAPAAKAVGINVETTTALLGTLANAGISGSKAGNNLKTSFINLNEAGLTLEEGLEKVANSEDKLGTAAKLVGKNAAASFLVLADGVDVTKELEKGLNNAGGAAKKMADEQLDTLGGKMKILNSAWEGLVLGLLAGDGAFSKISKSLIETATGILSVLTPSEELADTWFAQRDGVNELESSLNPLLDRYDSLKEKTELTKEEQVELDDIILKIAEDVPTAITEFDKYGKALDISTTAARGFIQQQKDLLALDNAEAISEQQDAIIDLNNALEGLNNTYIMRNGVLQTYSKELGKFLPADAKEILQFQKKGQLIRDEIALREAKIRKLKGEKTELELLAEAEVKKNSAGEDGLELTKEQIAAAEKRAKKLEDLRRKLEDLNNKAIEGDLKRQKAILNTKYEREIESFEKLENQTQVHIDIVIALKLARDKELLELDNKYYEEKEEKEADFNAKRNKRLDAEKIRATDNEEQKAELKTLQKFYDETDEIENNAFLKRAEKDAAIIQRAKELEIALVKIKKDGVDKKLDAEKKEDNARQKIEDDNKKERELRQKELKDAAKEAIDAIGGLIDEAFSKKLAAIDKELGGVGKRIDQLKSKAEEGQLDAEESLAFEQKKEAELERERERTRKSQAKAKAFFAILTSFNANDGDIGKTISDTAVLKSLASGFTAYDGVDDTGGRGNIDSKGGKLWTLHPNEQVWSKKDRGEVGFRDRDEIKNIVGLYDSGVLTSLMQHDKSQDIISPLSLKLNGLSGNADVVNKLNQLNQSIKGIDIPEGMVNIDEVKGLINLVSRKGNKITTERSKLHK
tara:strand:+ start:3483 stop:6947 length:3465 start_codon:yes stop_codon:yes gene_type:complete